MSVVKKWVEELLFQADVKINGDRPWDIQIKNENLFNRVMRKGSIRPVVKYHFDCNLIS